MKEPIVGIRSAKLEDAPSILAIYRPYVLKTSITFEYDVPSLESFRERMRQTLLSFPYLVAEVDEQIVGYAYASTYYARRAYDWTAEISIYLQEKSCGQHLGTQLFQALEADLKERGFRNLVSCISLPNDASLGFHSKLGFEKVGHFPKVGYKFGQWYDTVWFQKRID